MNNDIFPLPLFLILLVALASLTSCSANATHSKDMSSPTPSDQLPQITEEVTIKSSETADAGEKGSSAARNQSKQIVKEIDFANFTYPTTKELSQVTGQSEITLNNGNITLRDSSGDISLLMGLSHVFWGNVTGNDNTLDAVVALSYSMGGTAMPGCVYVYTTRAGKLKLLWSIDTGDRSNGGLRDIYSDNGNLVVETYNDEGLSACCAKSFTKSIYKWTNDMFRRTEAIKVSIQESGASPVYGDLKHTRK